MSITKIPFSASTNGRRISLADSATTIHTADATATDSIYLNISNLTITTELCTIQFGGVTNPDDLFQINIPPNGEGYWWVIKGDVLTNSLLLRALGATTDALQAGGYVLRDTGPS